MTHADTRVFTLGDEAPGSSRRTSDPSDAPHDARSALDAAGHRWAPTRTPGHGECDEKCDGDSKNLLPERAKRSGRVKDDFKTSRTNGRGVSRCEGCGWAPPLAMRALDERAFTRLLHAHHVVPIACGGADEASNLVLVCPTCHSIAHALGEMVTRQGRTVWEGPAERAHLIFELRTIRSPKAWAAYVGRGRNAAWELLTDEQRDAQRRGMMAVIA
jgi:hypothetical protein